VAGFKPALPWLFVGQRAPVYVYHPQLSPCHTIIGLC
jgi:hypothetical protein